MPTSGSTLDQLLTAAHRRDVSADTIWRAAAAAIVLLYWHSRFRDAKELAEVTITDLHALDSSFLDQDKPFDSAILIGCAEHDQDPIPALSRMRALLPSNSILAKRLAWLIKALDAESPYGLMTGAPSAWPAEILDWEDAELAEKDPAELSDLEIRRLWVAAEECDKLEIALRLIDAGIPVTQFPRASWIARKLIPLDRIELGTQLLLDTLPSQPPPPSAPWDIAPSGIMLQPDMRAAYADNLRPTVLARADISTIPGIEP